MLRIRKFEWKITLALLMTAAVPLVFTIFIVDRLVAESMAVGLNEQVLSGLRAGVDLYKEVIESRIRIVRLQGDALVRDAAFLDFVSQKDAPGVKARLEDLVAGNPSISRARLLAGDTAEVQESSPLTFKPDEWKSKIEKWELPGGRRLEVTLVIRKDFLVASKSLRDLVVTLEDVKANFQPWKMGYYKLFLLIYTWILVSAVVLGLLLSRSVTRRVARLALATRQAAAGDLNVRVPVKSADEIDELCASFNRMMDEIQRGRDRIVYLEKISAWQGIAQQLAHEIKNPLTPIQLAVQELHRSYRGDDQAFERKLDDSLEIVEEEVATLRRLVETFADFSKMPRVQAEPVELNAFVAEFLKHNPHIAGQVEFEPGPAVNVQLDRTMMGRVLINLVNNGLEASKSGAGVNIEVVRGDGWGTVRVSDHGDGLSEEARGRLFQPYFTTKSQGTGLGLAIVKKIVLQHGGEITVEDGRSSGTVFKVRLRAESEAGG